MDSLLEFFGTVAAAAAVPLCFYFLSKIFPSKPQALPKHNVSFDALRRKYAKWELAAMVPIFAFTVLFCYQAFRGLIWISRHSLSQSEENRYLMLPDPYFLMIFTMLMGIFFSVAPTALVWRLLLRKNYTEYNLYIDMKVGFDSRRALGFLSIPVLTPSMIFIILAMGCYVRFTDDQIITNRYWGFGETSRNYSEIARIESFRFTMDADGAIKQNPHHVVHFNDGSIWDTRETLQRADHEFKLSNLTADDGRKPWAEKEREIFTFVAKRRGIEVVRFNLFDKERGLRIYEHLPDRPR